MNSLFASRMKLNAIALVVLVACSLGCSKDAHSIIVADSPAAQRTAKKLKETILPSVEFIDTPLADALAYLQQRSVEISSGGDSPGYGVAMILDFSGTSGNVEGPHDDGGGFGFETDSPHPEITLPTITFTVENISVWDALVEVFEQSKITMYIDEAGRLITKAKPE